MAIPLPVTPNTDADSRGKRYDPRTVRTWAEVDCGALAGNVRAINAAFAPDGSPDAVMAIVKADAYGHGAVPMSRVCAASGIAHFAIATVEEGLILRQSGVRGEIYLLSSFVPDEAGAIVRGDMVPFLSSPEHFRAFVDAAKDAPLPARAFLVVDTGMGREGMLPDAARALWSEARAFPEVRLTGITSHLASADEPGPDGKNATRAQSAAFAAFVRSVAPTFADADDGRGGRGIWLSLCNSPGTIRRDEWLPIPDDLPGVRGVLHRAGLLLYGIEPHPDAFAGLPGIRQVLSWRARVTLVRDLPEGATVGYGRTHTLSRASRVATVAVGYADGFPRRLSDRGTVLSRGQVLPIIGRVSMDQLQIDVSDARDPVALGDTVTLLGTDGEGAITTLSFADSIGATAHEPTCYLSARVPRLYTGIPTRTCRRGDVPSSGGSVPLGFPAGTGDGQRGRLTCSASPVPAGNPSGTLPPEDGTSPRLQVRRRHHAPIDAPGNHREHCEIVPRHQVPRGVGRHVGCADETQAVRIGTYLQRGAVRVGGNASAVPVRRGVDAEIHPLADDDHGL